MAKQKVQGGKFPQKSFVPRRWARETQSGKADQGKLTAITP